MLSLHLDRTRCQAWLVRLLGEFASESAAQARADFLETKGIESLVRNDKSPELWVIDDDLIDQAQTLLAEFDGSEDHKAAAQSIRKERERKSKPLVTARGTPSGRPQDDGGLLTLGLIVVSVLVAFASSFGETDTAIIRELLVVPVFNQDIGGVTQLMAPLSIDWSQPWRLVTPMVIHFGLFHLVFNMMWLHLLGSQIEARHGTIALLLLAIAAQVAGSIAQFQLSGPLFGGMSGVNFALFGFVWMQARYAKRGYGLERRDTILLMVWLVVCATGLVGPIANAAHAMGLIVGVLAGLPVYIKVVRSEELRRPFEKGSWEDLNIKGWRRFDRLYVQPFVPFWFIAIALGVLLLDL